MEKVGKSINRKPDGIVFLNEVSCRISIESSFLGIRNEDLDRRCDFFGIFRRYKHACFSVFHELAIFRNIGCDDGEPCGHGLHDSIAHAFKERRENKAIRNFEKLWDIRAATEEVYVFFGLVAFNLLFKVFSFGAVADQEEFQIQCINGWYSFIVGRIEGFKGFEEVAMALVGVEVPNTDDDEIVGIKTESFAEL